MTKEEAFKNLVALHAVCGQKDFFDKEFEEALLVAEKALEQQPCEDATLKDIFCMGCEYKEQQPCEDAVSRQAVIDSIRNYFHDEYYQRTSIQDCRDCLIEDVIKSLPSVTPIRPKGEWKYDKTIQNWRCSKCNETPKTLGYVGTKEFMTEHFKFCNHCGADMKKEGTQTRPAYY